MWKGIYSKIELARFAHNWNAGIVELWVQEVWYDESKEKSNQNR